MEIIGFLVFIILLMAVVAAISAVRRDDREHIPPARQGPARTPTEVPDNSVWTLRIF
ncbi:hypothetical protein AB6813_06990 [bacterium RCC_150]